MSSPSVELDEVRGFLAKHEPFNHLPPEVLDELPAQMTMRYVRRGTPVVEFGKENHSLHIIRSGAVDIVSEDGTLVDRRDTGLNFGYSTLVEDDPVSHYTMETVEDSLILDFPRAAFTQLANNNPDVARFFSAQTRQTSAAARALEEDTTEPLRTKLGDVSLNTPVTAAPTVTIREAALIMEESGVSSLVLVEDTKPVGIITDRDFRRHVVARAVDPATPVAEIMTTNLLTVTPETMFMEALLLLAEKRIHHLPVTKDGNLVGIITQTDITNLLHDDPVYLAAGLNRATDLDGVFTKAGEMAVRYIDRGSSPDEVCGIMTMVADALARRLCEMAEAKLGAPPVPYAFVAVGSQGRREMGLASDQDNALVLDNSFDETQHGSYFAELGEFVCQGLAKAGQVLCPGNMMASNPEWRMTTQQWEETFHNWITAPEPEALLHAQVFFDFRVLYGSAELGESVHTSAVSMAKGARRLHAHLASLAARREPPLTFFRGLVVDRDGEYRNTLDVKKGGTAGIVQMARLFSLVEGSQSVETNARLQDAAGGAVSQGGAKELADAFAYLRQLTFQHQAAQVHAGQTPDYHIDPSTLSRLDRERLRDSFRTIKGMQNALATKYPVRNI
ncbi:histidine kinase [Corynebacterium phocae]|uniref:Histidine kinase n=1 Tax=Corynebacterium phocae TaxID=161895 RepID=A0A1L7D3T7_9CORY|nr:DUF294 nucleotidyltransferase-like domain-containing protein [Corynebacterium phocae]APT92671.1 histidine kinase [Corynebacterium phocae]KAA8723559.1 cyclic nucleotide-binding/CBS domain-containing protein [Corynebacterium phocae]